jgi:hypothetical protein
MRTDEMDLLDLRKFFESAKFPQHQSWEMDICAPVDKPVIWFRLYRPLGELFPCALFFDLTRLLQFFFLSFLVVVLLVALQNATSWDVGILPRFQRGPLNGAQWTR